MKNYVNTILLIRVSRVQIPDGSPNGSIAQLGEHLPYKQRVTGSSPVVPTKNKSTSFEVLLFFYYLQQILQGLYSLFKAVCNVIFCFLSKLESLVQ